jgi:hypothetical protein
VGVRISTNRIPGVHAQGKNLHLGVLRFGAGNQLLYDLIARCPLTITCLVESR